MSLKYNIWLLVVIPGKGPSFYRFRAQPINYITGKQQVFLYIHILMSPLKLILQRLM